MTTAAEARSRLVEPGSLDLVGPWPGHAFERELLLGNPTRWYLSPIGVVTSRGIQMASSRLTIPLPELGQSRNGLRLR
jgi:hypothetical protein